jgi:hypothetical protein
MQDISTYLVVINLDGSHSERGYEAIETMIAGMASIKMSDSTWVVESVLEAADLLNWLGSMDSLDQIAIFPIDEGHVRIQIEQRKWLKERLKRLTT